VRTPTLRNKEISEASSTLMGVNVSVKNDDEYLGMNTDYSYSIELPSGSNMMEITANSMYGAMYALDSFWQLVDRESAMIAHSSISITDSPDNSWRGLMIDAGRRFFPVDVVHNILDTMASAKLNVLHLHASDHCRFGVESKLFPNLTASLTGELGGFYTHEDIKGLIAYAGDRGIRVVPEFDVPGHSHGYLPIDGQVEFCQDGAGRDQLYGDPQSKTLSTLKLLLKEMSDLFEDEVFNIGADETKVNGPCTVQSTFSLEREVIKFVENELNKTAAGWEELLFDAGAATNKTIVDAWSRHSAAEITATGRRAIESKNSHFYFTRPAKTGSQGYAPCWYDISTGVPASQRHLLLGGEISMWSDTYCYIAQCLDKASTPPGATLFPPSRDAEFAKSVGGMIWPRGLVAAASFWHFDAAKDPTSGEFADALYDLNDALQAEGSNVCPSRCDCDQLTACGEPYIAP